MRDSEHRPEKFHGISLGNPMPSETRVVNRTHGQVFTPKPKSGSVVEDSVCFGETINEIGNYFNTLTDAEVLAVHVNIVFPNLPAGTELAQRALRRLGVEEERLKRIREEIKAITLR